MRSTLDIEKLSQEKNKDICIAGDFNFDLLKVASHQPTSEFFDIMTSNFFTTNNIASNKNQH